MALDQIWKQQFALVTYGNEYLSQNLSLHLWAKHSIFNQHIFTFRDLTTQHLLAQHFQVWLEGLKKQGVTRLSLHNSSLLLDEKNPNPNVELLPYPHFIVTHYANKKTAWICGKELAEWYTSDNDFEAPALQKTDFRIETMWRFDLNATHIKRVEADLQQPNWEDIQVYTDNELFDHPLAKGFTEPVNRDLSYYGYQIKQAFDSEQPKLSIDLPLLPDDYHADYANETLHRLDALAQYVQAKIKHPYNDNGEALTQETLLSLKHFQQKLEDLTAKFITKVANHYKNARIRKVEMSSPLDSDLPQNNSAKRFFNANQDTSKPDPVKHGNKGSVFTLILITVIICICAYYFGL
ncbi:hypothetical protein G9F32_00070 [Acinetobacter sp. 194]|uniref:hypothetical protein n=1 Tax=Acinetobacter shaoyimingii TaxID=2715164 RepID=UPI00140CEABB|nr:hypothetical protein [Acinetobacter shaoyimingii]NHB56432.1 hypothetical protein [Acinetobacter shaoyimingii]